MSWLDQPITYTHHAIAAAVFLPIALTAIAIRARRRRRHDD
jgi:hypothetical protein